MSEYHVIIIGSGPAGWTAAIYAARANFKPLVLRGPQPGGQLTTTTIIENYPGFKEGIDGNQLMSEMEAQAAGVGTDIKQERVVSVDFSGAEKTVTTEEGNSYSAPVVIIASGATARRLDIPGAGDDEYFSRGISTCATCDGFFFRKKKVSIIGGGDSAMEEAHYLSNLAEHVTIIHRRDELRASKIMQERILKTENIDIMWDSVITEACGTEGEMRMLNSLTIKNVKTDEITKIDMDGLFFAIGHVPNTDYVKGVCTLDDAGYLVIDERMQTDVTGVYGAGDVADTRYRQAITAAAMGCKAAMEAEKYLASLH